MEMADCVWDSGGVFDEAILEHALLREKNVHSILNSLSPGGKKSLQSSITTSWISKYVGMFHNPPLCSKKASDKEAKYDEESSNATNSSSCHFVPFGSAVNKLI